MTRIDLHAHSTVSDGTDTPSQLMRAAAAAELDVIALTDHDSTAGWAEAATAADAVGVTLIPGIELTTRRDGAIVHVLGYLFNPDDSDLVTEVERIRTARLTRANQMVERINRQFPLTWEEVSMHTEPGTTVGRPHIADALIGRGYVSDRPAAFAGLLSSTSPFYIPHYAPDPVRGVKLIRSAGGGPSPRASCCRQPR